MRYTKEEMLEITKEYSEQWKSESFYVEPDSMEFSFENYNLSNLVQNNPHKWCDFLLENELPNWIEQFGFDEAHEKLSYFIKTSF